MEFLNYTKKLNELAKTINDDNEILEEDIITAIFYMNNMYLNDVGDFLIFIASLNLCNAYVKINRDKISYSFKKGIEYLLDILNYRDINNIYVNCSNDNGKIYIFQIGDIQFSFHDEKNIKINEKYLKDLSWDGVKKQKCAKAIFKSTIKNEIRVSNITYRGDKLDDKLNKTLDNYRNNKISFDDLVRFKF